MRTFLFSILLACPLYSQLNSGTLTVTATRSMVVASNRVNFTASLTTGIDAAEDDVVAMLAPAGIMAANLTALNQTQSGLTWNFAWTIPLAAMKDTITVLRSLHVHFAMTGASVSDDLLAPSQCPSSDLLADAQAQAQKMASAIGAGVGPVLAVSNPAAISPGSVTLVGDFGFSGVLTGIIFTGTALPPSTLLNCSVTVTFGLSQ